MKEKLMRLIRKIKRGPRKYINGTKGVISIFLAILMLPFASIAGSLINAARINSAVVIFDEALSNASNSALGTYDKFLRKRFGLLAMSQNLSRNGQMTNQYTVQQLISETFDKYLEQNLGALSNTYMTYECSAEGIYSLADTDVLLAQILEYSKYNVPAEMLNDNFSVSDIIKSIENGIPGMGILDVMTAGAGVADKFMTLGEDFEALKKAIGDCDDALSTYENAYKAFEKSVSDYVTKQSEMQRKIVEQDKIITEEASQNQSLYDQIVTLEQEIEKLKEREREGEAVSQEIEQKEKELGEIKKNNESSLEKLEKARTEKNKIQNQYESTLRPLKTTIENKAREYSTSIDSLIGELQSTEGKITAVQKDIVEVGQTVGVVFTTAGESYLNGVVKDNNDKIKDLEKLMSETDDEKKKQEYQREIDIYKENNRKTGNSSKVISAQEDGFKAILNSVKTSITEYNVEKYSETIEDLRILKNKVDQYETNNMTSKLDKNIYYVTMSGLLSKETVEEAEKALVKECASSAIWGILEAIAGFFQALFEVALVYEPKLCAVIDMKYYQDTYGGLPADKCRDTYPLKEGPQTDKELSNNYKQLFGDYSATDTDALQEFDLIESAMAIFRDLSVITAGVGTITIPFLGILMFATKFKEICDAAKRIVENIKRIIEYLGDFLANVVGPKMLLSGYVGYMTSDRTTYNGAALTGSPFNLRGQISKVPSGLGMVDDYQALIQMLQSELDGGTDKCFVGAEKEYILFGSDNEIVNQAAAFLVIYILRVLLNIGPIFFNAEVSSIAAASTIAAPIVYLLYIFAEPLVDTFLLVNGREIPVAKTTIYLTPSGLKPLINEVTELKISTKELTEAQDGLLHALEVNSSYKEFSKGMTGSDVKEGLLDLSYSDTLLIIMTLFTSREKMLDRMSNIIQMESVEYMQHQTGATGMFDLDYSYTYIRAEGAFSTNEFLPISENNDHKSNKRIIYRGY